jgi:hypothetical protein
MTINLNLPNDLENQLTHEASQLQIPLSDYILRIISLRQPLSSTPKNGADLIAYWQKMGIIHSRPDITDSQAHARQLRHQAETRDHR